MARYAVMLRGINLGPRRRIPMADLRTLLTDAGFAQVATHLQSGNVVLASDRAPVSLETEVGRLISERFGFAVPVLARSGAELSAIVAHDPIPAAAQDPRRYQVTFLGEAPGAESVSRLQALVAGAERLAVAGRELYSFHPDGIARSRLAAQLTAGWLGARVTVRNWSTVTTLREMTVG